MIPGLIRRTVLATGVVGGIIILYLFVADKASAVAFTVALVWMLANLMVWTVLIRVSFNPVEGKSWKVPLLLMLKVSLLVVGVVMLKLGAPFQLAEILWVVGAISLVFIILALKAIGAHMVGADLLGTGRPTQQKRAGVGGNV